MVAAVGGLTSHLGCAPLVTPFVVYPTGQSTYTTCASYEGAQNVYPATAANAKGQSASTVWDVTQGVPTSSTDVNGLGTGYGGPVYEYSGSPSLATYQDAYTRTTLPGEAYGGPPAWTARVFAYSFCATASATTPCRETDTVRQLDGTNYAVSRAFYDRDGRLVETRTLGPTAGQDTVTFTTYDAVNDKVFASLPCQAATLTTSNGGRASASTPGYIMPASVSGNDGAYISPSGATGSCATVAGTTTYADALGRVVATDDPLGTGVGGRGSGCAVGSLEHHTTCADYAAVAASASPGLPSADGEPYLRTVTIDANLHQTATFTDALGRVAYTQRFSGDSQSPLGNGIASYAVSTYGYDALGRLRVVGRPSLPGPTFTYDATGRLTQSTDPNRGTTTYGYDPDGNLTSAVDARGPQGTTYYGYDGLDRPVWMGPNSTGTSPLAAWSYDGGTGTPCTAGYPVGRLCQETFASGPGQAVTGSDTYSYDNRGRTYRTVMALSGPGTPAASYTQSATYDDADRVATVTYPWVSGPTAETLTYGYANTAGGALASLTSSLTSPTATLFGSVSYTPQGLVSGWTGGTAAYQASESLSYDGDLRLANDTLTMTPNGGSATTVSAVAPSYDAAGNVATLTTTLAPVNGSGGGTETQAFCYDEQDRLVWASTQSTGSCGRGGSEGISGAGYTATYGYDANGHVTSDWVVTAGGADLAQTAQGSWTYNATQPDTIASIGSGGQAYSAAYDVNGDQTCRAYGSLSCANQTPAGESLTYDQLRRLIQWKNAAGTSTEQYAYDGEGERVWRQAAATVGSTTTTTTTSYVLGVQEWTSTAVTGQGTTTATTSLYPLPGGAMATRDPSGLTYQGSDALGTPVAAVNATSGVVGEQLFAPYGQARFSASAPTNGGMHTTLGFTGQHADSGYPGASGLDYFEARYLDPVVGQFTSADGVYPTLHDPAGLDPYAYVRGRVESARDPTGHAEDELDEEARGFAPADGLAVDVPGASAAATAADVPSVGGDTLTIEGPDGSTITYSDDGTQVTIHNAAGSETIEDNPFQAPTETFENQATAHAADAQASGTTATTPTTPTTPAEGPSTGEGPSNGPSSSSGNGEPPAGEATSSADPGSTTETVYTFGNAQGIRGARGADFAGADTNALSAQNPAEGPVNGMSATVNPAGSGLTGVYYSLPEGTPLPDGVGAISDGVDVGGEGPPGHVTFYPTMDMSLDEFNGLLRSLPWTRAGRI